MKNLFLFVIIGLIVIKSLYCQNGFHRITFPPFPRFDIDSNNNYRGSNSIGFNSPHINARPTEEKNDDFRWMDKWLLKDDWMMRMKGDRSEIPKQKANQLGFQNNFQDNWKLNAANEAEKGKNSKSVGKCGIYVSRAIQRAKGIKEGPTGIGSAKDFSPFLNKMGYQATSKDYSQAKPGDIAVFDRAKGKRKDHKDGHIQILGSDKKWISDYKQNKFNPWSDVSNPSYVIYE